MSDHTAFRRRVGRGHIELVCGNIVAQRVDAIVNAANTKLCGGGGVDGAIHRAAGKALAQECRRFPADADGRRCPTGEVRVTGAGDLPAKVVLHAVGPFYNARSADRCEALLRAAHENALAAAAERGCRTVAFPAISTGAYRFPVDRAAAVALSAVAEFLTRHGAPAVVRFVLFKQPHFEAFREALSRLT
jgi:O-acetyl-ADP-ribose deacetylase